MIVKLIVVSLFLFGLVSWISPASGWQHHSSSYSAQSQQSSSSHSSSHTASASRTVDGATFQYKYENGKETLHVEGNLPESFDKAKILQEFRDSLGIKIPAASGDSADQSTHYQHDPHAPQLNHKSLFESVSDFLASTTHLSSNLKNMYESFVGKNVEEQIQRAKEEKTRLQDELAEIMTQKLVLTKRQGELGRYITENIKKSTEDRNPTVDDLVITEDDRLALLESRLERMHNRVTEQIRSIDEFLETHAIPQHHYTEEGDDKQQAAHGDSSQTAAA